MSVFGTTLIIGASITVAAVGVAVVAAPEAVGAVSGMPAALQVNTNTAGAVQGGIRDFAVSGNGRYVTFNGAPDQYGAGCTLAAGVCGTRLYAKDLVTGAVAPVGDPATAGTYPNGNALASAMDYTGRFVAFVSTASNMVSGEGAAGAFPQVFVRDRDTDGNGVFDEPGKTSLKLLSREWDLNPGPGSLQPVGVDPNGIALSADAKYLAYVATENGNQVVHVIDRNFDHSGHMDDDHDTVNRRIATFPGTTPLSLTDMSPDGRYIVVGQRAGAGSSTIIDRDSDHNGVYDESKTITASTLPAGLQAISITGDARKVLVQTNASYNTADTASSGDGYIYDRDADGNGVFDETGAGKISFTLVTQRTDGTVPSDAGVQRLAEGMSRDGRYVLFASQAVNGTSKAVSGDAYTADDNNGVDDYFLRDLATKTITRISDVATGYTASIDAASLSGRVGRSAMLEGNVAVINAKKGTATDTFTQAVGAARTWSVSGPAGSTLTNAGGAGHPQFTYNVNLGTNGTGVTDRTWTFSSTATTAGAVDVPYTYAGFHANANVKVHLVAFVTHKDASNNVTTTNTSLIAAGPSNGSSTPAGGFSFSGTYSFNVVAGDIIGFTLGGSNTDKNSVLNGVFTLAPQPFTPTAPQTAFNPSSLSTIADNTSWPTATTIGDGTVTGALQQPGEARWYKFPVIPDSQEKIDLTNLPQNYDLTVYGDIGASFSTLTTPSDLVTLSAQFAGSAYAPSIYSPSIYSPSIYSPSIYSPSIYSPSIYSPSIYSPSIYSPSIYSPSIYSPSIYSPSIYSPSIYSPSIYSPSIYSPTDAFTQAFSSAQTRSLLAVSGNEGTSPESIHVNTWNNTGYFYVRVLGRNGAADPLPYTLSVTTTGGPCTGVTLDTHATDTTLYGAPDSASTVILTDSSRWSNYTTGILPAKLTALATATNGAVVDLALSQKVQALNAQADNQLTGATACPYAKNLVAQAIRDIVNTYRGSNHTLKYVVIVGGDNIVPYVRYADGAGIGPENDYVPPVGDGTPAQASLRNNYVFGQDAYGTMVDVPMQGGVLPVPDLAVGRLVETPSEIGGMIDAYLGLTNGVLPAPKSSLVTGYDFLQNAADSVNTDFTAGMLPGSTNDALITNQGVSTLVTTPASGPTRDASWTAADFSNALMNSHHDLLFLAGHFSANSALAADYTTSFITNQLDVNKNLLTNSLVISAGCHSAYNIQDPDGVPYLTNGLDWAEEMAIQRATFVGGTGYQYADTDFLAYSAKLYTQMAKQLRTGTGPVAVGDALVRAKQAYLEGLSSVSGIDQKALIEATVYGLPMISVDMPGTRLPAPAGAAGALTPSPVAAGTPGGQLGLQTLPFDLSPVLDADHGGLVWTKQGADPVTGTAGPSTTLQWHTGRDGVQSGAGLPTLPKQLDNVTSTNGTLLRGVGFRSGSYTDATGVTPLTGAPTTEQNGVHTSFGAGSFFPQKLTSVNYFDALATSGAGAITNLVSTPVQYRAEIGKSTNTERVYQHVGLSLFYSSNISQYGGNVPALAAPPSITGVTANTVAGGSSVAVSAHITGDPSAGIQQVWVTYTGEHGPFNGTWASVDLTQDSTDSTLWFGRINLPAGQNSSDVRIIVQAVNGVGLVGLDNNFGDGYIPDVFVGSVVRTASLASTLTFDAPVPASARLGSTVKVGATLAGAGQGTPVEFSIGSSSANTVTDATGHATVSLTLHDQVGPYTLNATYGGDATHLPTTLSAPFTIERLPTTTAVVVPAQTKAVQAVATLTGPSGEALAHQAVTVTVTGPGFPAASPLQTSTFTDGSGQVSFAQAFPGQSLADGTYTFAVAFAGTPSTFLPSNGSGTFLLDTTGPVVTVATKAPAANGAGWNNNAVTITWACSDAGSGMAGGLASCPAPTTVNTDGGSQTISVSATDALGNTGTQSTTVSLDQVGPTLVPTQSPAANGAGWNNTPVTVSWDCTDLLSGVASCPTSPAVGETSPTGQVVTGTATDVAGNSTTVNYGPVKVDLTKPTLTGTPTVAAPATGWYTGDVVIHWTCNDIGSGIAGSCPADATIKGEGASLNIAADVSDVAGNEQHADSQTVQIDRTPPTTSTDAVSSWYSAAVDIHLVPTDNISGVGQTFFQLDGGTGQYGTTVTVPNGTHTISFYSVDNAGNKEATQTVTVKVDASAPSITHVLNPLPGADGWNNSNVIVTFTCAAPSGISSCTTPQTVTGEGRDQQVTGTATNTLNRTSTDIALVSIDRTPPAVVGAPTAPATNGWYNNPVMVHFTCIDPPLSNGGVPSGVASCSNDVTLSGNGAGQSVSGSGSDKAGNSATATSSLVSIDQVPPTISVAPTTQPNAAGWYKGPVTFHFNCADTLSGLASCPADKTISGDGSNLTVTGDAFDVAGNKASVVSAPVKIDSSVPNESVTGVKSGAFYTTAPKPVCTTTDPLSGVATNATVTVSGTGGSVTATCTGATDIAGNATPPTSVTYLVIGSVKVSAKFTPGGTSSIAGDVLPGLNGTSTATLTASAFYASTGALNASVSFVYNITNGLKFTSTSVSLFTMNGADSWITGVGTISGRTGSFPFQVFLHSGTVAGSGPSRTVVTIYQPTTAAPTLGSTTTPTVLYQASGNLASTDVKCGRDD